MSFWIKCKQWHNQVMARDFLSSSHDWRYVIGAIVLILLAGFINYETRQAQWQYWQDNPDQFYANGSPLASTTDAAYFLSLAENYGRGVMGQDFSQSRLYPDQTIAYQQTHNDQFDVDDHLEKSVFDIPLLSVVIHHVADWFYDGNLLMAGNAMIPITGFLTAVMVGLMFWAAGYPAEGAIAGTGIGLSSTYLIRTSVGRIDTDQLVVFFLALCLAVLLVAARQRNLAKMLAFSLLMALSMLAFFWWYLKSPFVVLLPLLLGFGVYTQQWDWRRASLAVGFVVIAINPLFYFGTVGPFALDVFGYLTGINTQSDITNENGVALSFPNTFSTITELAKIDFVKTLEVLTSHAGIGSIGVIGFIGFLITRPSKGVIFLPFFMMGMLSFIAGRRFAFFAAPFVWFGVAWLSLTLTRVIASAVQKKMVQKKIPFIQEAAVLVVSAVMVLGSASILSFNYMPRPSFDRPTVETFAQMRSLNKEKSGVFASWWDYGYMAHFKSGMNTIHDGGLQKSPRTHLFARGLVSPEQRELIQITKFITKEGNEGIYANAQSLEALNQAIIKSDLPERPIYLVMTSQMQSWAQTIAKLGKHDVVNGITPPPNVLRGYGYIHLSCKNVGPNKLQCNHGLLDLNHGTLDGKSILNGMVEIRAGKQTAAKKLNQNGQFVLMVINSGNHKTRLVLVPNPLWNSSFNQLFHLGTYDQDHLELVIDNYPTARVYKVLQ